MRRMVFLLLVVGAGYGTWMSWKAYEPVKYTVDGSSLTATGLDLDARFTRGRPISATYMLFRGYDRIGDPAIGVTVFFGLESHLAAVLVRQDPDLYRCQAGGTTVSNKLLKQIGILAADGEVREALRDALARHKEAIRSGGDRVCVAVAGSALVLNTVRSLGEGRDMTQEVRDHYIVCGDCGPPSLIYGEHVETVDCRDLP